jgi:putative CocE/NonD family hydrolase
MPTPVELIVERNVEAAMRDGTILRANVYRPDLEEPLPVLLQRTPYNKDGSDVDFCMLSAERGYAVVVQDTRGCWASEGEHYPFRDEFEDGYDTVEWAASQPWAGGKVGMWGSSYVGYTQWAAAVTQPPSLAAIFPSVTFADQYADLWYPGGALALGVLTSWSLGFRASMAIQRMDVSDEERVAWQEELADALDGLSKGTTCRTLPLSAMPLLSRQEIGQVRQAYLDIIAHAEYEDHWRKTNMRPLLDQIAVPAYHLGGWYDIFVGGTLTNYVDMCRSTRTGASQKLIMGPWLHGPLSGWVGEVDFGVRASDMYVLHNEIMWRWFDRWLKGIDNGIMDEPPVCIFVMGRNRWRDEQEWPLARTVYTPWYLLSSGHANSCQGDGALSLEMPVGEQADSYTYDPRDPVPTRGGGLCCWQAALTPGAFDQRQVEERDDVLVYTSDELEEDLEVTGSVKVVLWAASDAVDTDITAKLVDVYPCGYARNVLDGIVRARYRHSTRQSELLTPGAVEQYTIDLGATSNVFLEGHRVRVEISSSNFPRFDRNPNTGYAVGSEAEMRIAAQTIYHDAQHPSHILLPVIPE